MVAEDGAVYTCGAGLDGLLGLGDEQPRRRLTRVPQAVFAGSRVVMVTCVVRRYGTLCVCVCVCVCVSVCVCVCECECVETGAQQVCVQIWHVALFTGTLLYSPVCMCVWCVCERESECVCRW